MHFRGPCKISKIAVYHKSAGSKAKREAEAEPDPAPEPIAHAHQQAFPALGRHKRAHGHRHERRGVVTVTDTVYSTKTRFHTTPSSAAPSSTPTPSTPPSTYTPPSSGYTWTRDSYYDASSGTQTNMVFMNHLGGTAGSGSWGTCFGNCLSYAASNGVTAASSPQTLGSVVIPSDNELVIFQSAPCDSSCGFVRSGSPGHKGFDTSQDTIFLLEFEMPSTADSGFKGDMPAFWFLNAEIPRTLQYGLPECSCWTTGCGELDIFEVLVAGSNYLTSTLHTWQGTGNQYGGGGTSNYFMRPTSSMMTAAIVFSAS